MSAEDDQTGLAAQIEHLRTAVGYVPPVYTTAPTPGGHCRLFHDWAPWEFVQLGMQRWNGTRFERAGQARQCERCGKLKIRRI